MKLIIIAAINKKRVIGKSGKIPWHIPEDLQRFKQLTTNHTVLMGRKTFESIGKPLPNRRNVVISKNQNLSKSLRLGKIDDTLKIFSSIESALSNLQNEEKVFVIGGGEIFRQTIERADELLLTLVDNNEEGDVFFPEVENEFDIIQSEQHIGFAFQHLKRKR